MALKLYEYNEDTNQFDEITAINPISSSHNGVDGETVTQKLFIRNDDLTKWYSGITILPTSTPDDLVSAGNVAGWEVKLLGGDTAPTEGQWTNRVSGTVLPSTANMATASPRIHFLPQIGTAVAPDDNYYPFWLRIVVPVNTRNRTENGISLTVDETENAI